MRLLHTQTLEFQEFFDSRIPPYAILSHRWGQDEVTFKEMRKRQAPLGVGLAKIQNFCFVAAQNGFEWAWIDTCCIDKRSSAELSEAINAMYKWYENASHVYVHLRDFEIPKDLVLKMKLGDPGWYSEIWPTLSEKFRGSSWFTRGWTLQELLAPRPEVVYFFDADWNIIGSLTQLIGDVSMVTRIPVHCMGFKLRPSGDKSHLLSPSASTCIAQRMSWAADRETSREEDMAYCLLGLLDVNMPLLYGEGGEKAFYRLQIEIMNTTEDESLFAWTSDQKQSGLLAASPRYFRNSGTVKRYYTNSREPSSMTNKGLRINIPKKQIYRSTKFDGYIGALLSLYCYNSAPAVLCLLSSGGLKSNWIRIRCDTINGLKGDMEVISFQEMNRVRMKDLIQIYVIDPNKEDYRFT